MVASVDTNKNAATSEWSTSALVRETRLEPSELARYLRVTSPAFDRCLDRDRFSRQHRSKLLRLIAVLDRAERVLGDRARAIYWLLSANRALDFNAPLASLDTKSSIARVYEVLLRIENGAFA